MKFIPTTLRDAFVIEPQVFEDERGFFLESYSKSKFEEAGVKMDFVQDNHSMSTQKGVLRGLHFQSPPHTQAKLVRVAKGSVYDVIVDMRKYSETFGKWEGFELSKENFRMLYVPEGFAHGFCTLEDNTEFLYKAGAFYDKESEGGIAWDDPDLAIDWPTKSPTLNERDETFPSLRDVKNPF